MTNAQEFISSYNRNQRKTLKKLDISQKELTGELVINNWKELVMLDCSRNQLTKLHIKNCSKLRYVYVWANQITGLEIINSPNIQILRVETNKFTSLEFLNQISHPEKMIDLRITNNKNLNLDSWELNQIINHIGRFVNLQKLGICNMPFTGSLAPLGIFTKLEWLDIRSAKFNSGIESLPTKLKEISCNTNCDKNTEPSTNYPGKEFDNIKCWIEKEHCCFGSQTYDYQEWKRLHVEELITLRMAQININRDSNSLQEQEYQEKTAQIQQQPPRH